MDRLLVIKLDNGSTLEAKAPAELEVKPHDTCVFRRDFYTDAGEVVREVAEPPESTNWAELPTVQHIADNRELAAANDNYMRSRGAMRTARELVGNLGLAMKLLNAHYSLDGKLVVIQFSADGRVDFRELVKELSRALCTRIELRQIGVRDESKMIGGLGICGQPFCCSRFLKDFQPVSIKMAKEQGLSLNPTKISGACGRLMCCLAYEESAYEYLNSIMPMVGSTVRTPDGLGTVLEVNPVSGYLRVRCGTESLAPRYYKVGVCEYVSGGKRPPRRPDPDDDYSGVRNPAPVVASSDDEKRPACPRRRTNEKE